MIIETSTTSTTILPAGSHPDWGFGMSWSRPVRGLCGTLFGSMLLRWPVWLGEGDFRALSTQSHIATS